MHWKVLGTLSLVFTVVLFILPYELWEEVKYEKHNTTDEHLNSHFSQDDLPKPLETKGYLLYTPYAGLSSSVISIGKAIYIASKTNRALVVSPLLTAQTHPLIAECIYTQLGNITFSEKCIQPEYDFLKFFQVDQHKLNFTVPPLRPLHQVYHDIGISSSIPCHEEWRNSTCDSIIQIVQQSREDVVCVGNLFFVENCPSVRHSFKFTQQASQLFDTKMQQYGMVGNFIGIHVRKGDFLKYCRQFWANQITKCDPSYPYMFAFSNFMRLSYNIKHVAVATSDKDKKILSQYPSFWLRSNISDFSNELEHALFDMYMLTKSYVYVGNAYSSFSTFIKIMKPSLPAFIWDELNWDSGNLQPKHQLEQMKST